MTLTLYEYQIECMDAEIMQGWSLLIVYSKYASYLSQIWDLGQYRKTLTKNLIKIFKRL